MDGGIETDAATAEGPVRDALPDYLVKTYWWAYLNPVGLVVFDNPVFLTVLLWGNLPRLVRETCTEFEAGQRVLQAACAYGTISEQLAETVGPNGRLDVIDIAPIQVEHNRRKLARFPHARVRVGDATELGAVRYDAVCSFFLLHEVPDEQKAVIVDGLLDSIPTGGKAVFIDYHQTEPWHPLRPVMHMVYRLLEPYAFGLIDREIRDFASRADDFTWRKETLFGGLYQKVVAVRIKDPVSAATGD